MQLWHRPDAMGVALLHNLPPNRPGSGITLDSDIFDLRRAGRLHGTGGFEQGLGFAVQPYGLARYNSADGADSSGDLGLGIKYGESNLSSGRSGYEKSHLRSSTQRL